MIIYNSEGKKNNDLHSIKRSLQGFWGEYSWYRLIFEIFICTLICVIIAHLLLYSFIRLFNIKEPFISHFIGTWFFICLYAQQFGFNSSSGESMSIRFKMCLIFGLIFILLSFVVVTIFLITAPKENSVIMIAIKISLQYILGYYNKSEINSLKLQIPH